MYKELANLEFIKLPSSIDLAQKLEQIGRFAGLRNRILASRQWEYPWAWSHLSRLSKKNLQLLDVGSGTSPMPWFLAKQGFQVIISDISNSLMPVWQKAAYVLNDNDTEMEVLNVESLDVESESCDIYTSISVLEHIQNRGRTIQEAIRVLRPGGILMLTCDIIEEKYGMSYLPELGNALHIAELESLFNDTKNIDKNEITKWDFTAIESYLSWLRQFGSTYNYCTAGIIVQKKMVS